MPAKKKRKTRPLITSHLSNISRALLEGDKRPAFLEFLKTTDDRRGIYALYANNGKLYYAGKASDLPKRLDNHLEDMHAEDRETMSLFFLSKSANISQMEGLLIAGGKPNGNKRLPRIGKDVRQALRKFLKTDALDQIDLMIFPNKKLAADKLAERITPKKLKKITQNELADTLGISQARVSQLTRPDRKNLKMLRRYIMDGGHRDKVLRLLK
jgi:Sec-independent protein translocase protein TatA